MLRGEGGGTEGGVDEPAEEERKGTAPGRRRLGHWLDGVAGLTALASTLEQVRSYVTGLKPHLYQVTPLH